MASEKTWAQVRTALDTTMRHAGIFHYAVESPFEGARAVEKRKAGRAPQTEEQRNVTLVVKLSAIWRQHASQEAIGREIRMTSTRGETALENLDMLQRAFETIRLTAYRGLDGIVYRVYRQMFPVAQQQQQQTPPPRSERVSASGPYATLHIANDAPLEVAEAAYRALVKQAHPDINGNAGHAQMVALNAAIEQIRRMKREARPS